MTLTPARHVLTRGAIGVALALAVTGVAAPSLAAGSARSGAPASGSTTCIAGASETMAEAASYAGSGARSSNTRPDDGMAVSRDVASAVQGQLADRVSARAAQALPNNSVSIPVVAHIILGKKKRAGHMTRAGINDQIAAMNVAYSGGEAAPGVSSDTAFRFRLKKVTKTRNQKWYRINQPESRNAVAMKKRLHRGGRHTLNLYFVAFSGGLLGYSTFPWNAHGKRLKLDGTVIDYRSRPGGELTGFNQGDTGVHEVGHWLGLLHTFEGGCGTADAANSGDFVTDTPPEAKPTAGCPLDGTKNTCIDPPSDANPAGVDLPDPIHNFMDYASDACMTTFSPGQADRMAQAWLAFRA